MAKGENGGQRLRGIYLQPAYSGMLIRSAKTRLPLKCHILVRRAASDDGVFCGLVSSERLVVVCLPFPVAISFLFSLPQAFSLNILRLLLSALLLCCLLCDEWLYFKLSIFFSFS